MKNREEKHKIILLGKEYEYTLVRKKVKYLNVRAKADKTFYVSAHPKTDIADIEKFIVSNAEKIVDVLENAKPNPLDHPPALSDGSRVRLFGEDVTVKILKGDKKVCFEGGCVMISLPNPDDEAEKQKLYTLWEAEALFNTVERYVDAATEDFKKFGIPRPKTKYRRMKTRWATCNIKTGVLTFNLHLAKFPNEAIELVVYHEFCHFIHPDHQKGFHSLLESFFPDAKERQKMLKL